jgi:thiamine-monophosphate kinase
MTFVEAIKPTFSGSTKYPICVINDTRTAITLFIGLINLYFSSIRWPILIGVTETVKDAGSGKKAKPQRHSPPDRGELELIRALRKRVVRRSAGVRLGIGDDCALIGLRGGEEMAVTTDLSIDGRHFRLDWHPPEAIGHRVLARGVSDLAAMGARPVAAFLSLGLPRSLTVGLGTPAAGLARGSRKSWSSRFFDGLLALAEVHRVELAGGDLAESPVALADIVLLGAVPRGKALLRSGARPGDLVYVTGTLGGAAAGLALLSRLAVETAGSKTQRPAFGLRKIAKRDEPALAPHLYPQPRVAPGLWLRRRGAATAAIDISDGLSTELFHLCEESGVAAEIESAAVPVAPGATREQALHGGEDYELLFTARAQTRIPRSIGSVPVTCIGRVTKQARGKPWVMLNTPAGSQPFECCGWEHFS